MPADLRLVQSSSLRIEESALTGESVPVDKTPGIVRDPDAPLGDRTGMVFSPLGWDWRLSKSDLSVNYIMAAARPD